MAVTVEEVGSDEGEVPASENVKFDHGKVRRGGCGGEVKLRRGGFFIGTVRAFILVDLFVSQ